MDSINKQLLSLKEEGMSLRQIAKEVNLSHVGVKKRLDRLANPNIIKIEANLYGFEHRYPLGKVNVNSAISRLNSVLEELELYDTDKKIIINAGMGWKFEKAPW
jgi:predicted ArsR family transcriptional regulator